MTVTFTTFRDETTPLPATFEAMRFPAGEAHMKVAHDNTGPGLTEVARIWGADGGDLFTLAMWADACHRRAEAHHASDPASAPHRTVLLMPYLPGARADHAEFVPLGSQVYADFINSLRVDVVVCFDPHSPVMPGMLDRARVVDPAPLIRDSIVAPMRLRVNPYTGIIAPDRGATARAAAVAEACDLPLYQAFKHRDPDTGKLSGFSCDPLPDTGRFLVVDDICDGGGTFAGLADAAGLPPERLSLFVSHGVFSGHARAALESFGEVWTTDSYRPVHEYADRMKLAGLVEDASEGDFTPMDRALADSGVPVTVLSIGPMLFDAVQEATFTIETGRQQADESVATPSRVQTLRKLIDELVVAVAHLGGADVPVLDAWGEMVTSWSSSDATWVVLNAQADGRLVYSLRRGTVSLPDDLAAQHKELRRGI
ncbi:MAG: hypothetical protein B7X41_05440 [Microbacterium sp. 14-71-5]|jgi:ribose-phosphate pyrophosphokinase|nr:MAG: hypothetical protein B7X41_05440 [Microbacterium sp. 14-71-5]